MLHRVTEALGTTVAACFSDQDVEPLTVYHAGERPIIRLGSTGSAPEPSLERLTPYKAGRALNANFHVVPPGAGSEGALKHAGEEVGFVIQGVVELTVDGRSVVIAAGDRSFSNHHCRTATATWAPKLRESSGSIRRPISSSRPRAMNNDQSCFHAQTLPEHETARSPPWP